MEVMKNEDLYECFFCVKIYYKFGWFKKYLEKKYCWKFCSVENMDVDLNFVYCFFLMFLLLRDICNVY